MYSCSESWLCFLKDLLWQLWGRVKRKSVDLMKEKIHREKKKSHCLLKSYVENTCNNSCLWNWVHCTDSTNPGCVLSSFLSGYLPRIGLKDCRKSWILWFYLSCVLFCADQLSFQCLKNVPHLVWWMNWLLRTRGKTHCIHHRAESPGKPGLQRECKNVNWKPQQS